jgi:hypothetical protein
MTLVELMDKLRIEAAASGVTITEAEDELTGEMERLRKWIIDAWKDIQRRHTSWRFLFVESSYTMTANESTLAPTEYTAGEVAEWHEHSFRMAEAGGARKDSQPLMFWDYFDFRDGPGLDITVAGKPTAITAHPEDEALMIAPPTDTARVLFYDYWRTPQILEDNEDEPIMPARYHDLIVWWALRKYALHESAVEALTSANAEIGRLLPELEMDQLRPMVQQGLLD